MIVLDASAAAELVLGLRRAGEVERRIAAATVVHAPHLLGIEVAQVVRRYALAGEISERRGAQALQDLSDLGIVRHAHEPLLELVWRRRVDLTAYDAAYVVLAEVLDVDLVTLDAKLASAPGHDARIDLIS